MIFLSNWVLLVFGSFVSLFYFFFLECVVVLFWKLTCQLKQMCIHLRSPFPSLSTGISWEESWVLCWRWAIPIWVLAITHRTDQHFLLGSGVLRVAGGGLEFRVLSSLIWCSSLSHYPPRQNCTPRGILPTQHITGKLLWTLKVEASWILKHSKERLILALTDKSTWKGSMGRDLPVLQLREFPPELGRRVKAHFSWVLSLCQAGAPLLFHSHFPAFIIVEIGSSVIMHNMSNEGTEFFQARSADSGCGPRVESV